MSKYGFISGLYFPVFGLNTVKHGLEITPYLDTFHVVKFLVYSIYSWTSRTRKTFSALFYCLNVGEMCLIQMKSTFRFVVVFALNHIENEG